MVKCWKSFEVADVLPFPLSAEEELLILISNAILIFIANKLSAIATIAILSS